jgi:hypothetical protein
MEKTGIAFESKRKDPIQQTTAPAVIEPIGRAAEIIFENRSVVFRQSAVVSMTESCHRRSVPSVRSE